MSECVIGMMGYAGSGKDTFAERLVDAHGFKRIAFADPLREMALQIDPSVAMPWNDNYGTPEYWRLSYVVDQMGWTEAKKIPEVRRLLQVIGTNAVRDIVDQQAWIKVARRKVAETPGMPIVFTDVRFPNEIAAIGDMGGYTVRVRRPGTGPANGHDSETALDEHEADFTVVNNKGIAELHDQADDIVQRLTPSWAGVGR